MSMPTLAREVTKMAYKVEIKCWNCDEKVTVEMEQGHLVDEARANTVCKNCGCNLNATIPS